MQVPFLLATSRRIRARRARVEYDVAHFRYFLRRVTCTCGYFGKCVLLGPFLRLLVQDGSVAAVYPFIVHGGAKVTSGGGLSPAVQVGFRNGIFRLVGCELRRGASVFFRHPAAPVKGVFHGTVATPARSLSASQPG